MQIVIDIKKREWEYLNKLVENGDQLGHYERLLVNGTPLPKGHGRLIDADALDLEHEIDMADDWKTAHEIANCAKYAPTIIEADKSESEE